MATTQTRATGSQAERAMGSAKAVGLSMGWKWAIGLILAYVCFGAFFIAQGGVNFTDDGNTARIVFFHVPIAILSYVWYAVAAVYALYVLFKPAEQRLDRDKKSAVAMELGFLCCILATITGSIFAGAQWGSYWNWDPRETSIVAMLLLYAAYLSLRGAMAEAPDRRAKLCAAYTFILLVPATFLIWVVPRIPGLQTLHPTETLQQPRNTSWDYKAVLYPSFFAFTMLFVWLFQLRCRIIDLAERQRSRRAHSLG